MKIKTYELQPVTRQKSFYGKAKVHVCSDGSEVLQSYDTLVLTRKADGTLVRHWDYWSATTGKHIAAFAGLNKADYGKLPYEERRSL